MQALPKDLRDIVERNLDASGADERADMQKIDDTLEKTFQGRGIQVSKPDLTPFRAAIRNAKLYDTWRTQFGPQVWALLEKTAGKLA